MIKLVLIRHGKTEGNKQGVYTGWTNTMLSKDGIEELHELKETHTYPKTDRYYTSDLQRAIDTFNILYPDKEIHESTRAFREVHFGIKENKPANRDSENAYYKALLTNNDRLEGETISQVGLRIFGKLFAIFKEMEDANEDSLTIVCH
ncbi:MAG TPA: phosphoglycerate mutase family protein, partial [Erysipelothrix sp.]|nr:phosphoglycerate mutase family protein [Erysipelothrix sp.]